MQNISVDEILAEINKQSGRTADAPLPSMEKVDDLISGILSKRQDDMLSKSKKELTLKEKKELDDEIKEQTKNLTAQIDKLCKSGANALNERTKGAYVRVEETTRDLQVAPVQKRQQVKYRDTESIKLSQEIKLQKQQRLEKVEQMANSTLLRQDVRQITDRFETERTERAEEPAAKPAIDMQNYRELKDNRSKKIDSFVLNPKKPPTAAEAVVQRQAEPPVGEKSAEAGGAQNEPFVRERTIKPIITESDAMAEEFEYTDAAQTDEIRFSLYQSKKQNFICTVILGVLSLLSLAFLFLTASGSKLTVAGILTLEPSGYVYLNLGFIAAAIAAGYSIIVNAFHSIADHKQDKDIMYSALMALALGVVGVFCLNPESLLTKGIHIFTPIFVIEIFCNHLSKHFTFNKIIKNFEFISTSESKSAVSFVSPERTAMNFVSGLNDMDEPIVVKSRRVNFADDFLTNAFESDKSDALSAHMLNYGLLSAVVIFLAALLLTKNVYLGLSLGFAAMLLFSGVLCSFAAILPIRDSMSAIAHFAGAVPDYSAVEIYQDVNAALFDAGNLFKGDNVVLHGIKTFQGKRIDEAIVDAASILSSTNSILKNIFLEIISDNEALLRPVDSVVYEDSMGLSGWVDQKRVLVGNRELMINHSIAVPNADYEKKYRTIDRELIYISTDGELCAAFVVQFKASRAVHDVLTILYKNGISPIIKTTDFCVTAPMLERIYDIEPGFIKIIPSRLHREFDEQTADAEHDSAQLCQNGTAFGFAVSLCACKRMFPCIRLGGVLHMASAICGAVMLLLGLFLNLTSVFNPIFLLLFMLFFTAAFWIYERNIKL